MTACELGLGLGQDGRVDRDEVDALRALLAPTGWPERARVFARALRTSTLWRCVVALVGTPADEPWHLAAHLDDESRLSGIAELAPTLVRWNAPADAPPHLRVGLERLARRPARRDTVRGHAGYRPLAAAAGTGQRRPPGRRHDPGAHPGRSRTGWAGSRHAHGAAGQRVAGVVHGGPAPGQRCGRGPRPASRGAACGERLAHLLDVVSRPVCRRSAGQKKKKKKKKKKKISDSPRPGPGRETLSCPG